MMEITFVLKTLRIVFFHSGQLYSTFHRTVYLMLLEILGPEYVNRVEIPNNTPHLIGELIKRQKKETIRKELILHIDASCTRKRVNTRFLSIRKTYAEIRYFILRNVLRTQLCRILILHAGQRPNKRLFPPPSAEYFETQLLRSASAIR